jgi:hypothetical protein
LTPMRFASTFVVLAVALGGPALAQETPIPITEAELTASSWGAKEGKLVELANVKFRDYFDPHVRLVKLPADKLRLDASTRTALANNLSGFRTATGQLDKKGRSNVRVVGIARDDSTHGHYIDVTDVTRLPDDIDNFKKRADGLPAGDADARMKLADEARKRADTFSEDDVREFARTLYDAALDLKKAALPKGDVAAAIDVAFKYRDLAGASSKAIALLGEVVLDASIEQAERDKARAILEKDLQAVLHRDKWISREEFKVALGYLQRRDGAGQIQWLRRERVEFEQAVAKQREANKNDPNLRKLLGSEYETAAAEGRPTIGMLKQELVRTKGYGFAELVDRFTEKSAGNADLTWDQWVMPDGSRFYFMNGILFDWKKKDVPWPTKG